ncbi:GTPase Era [Mycoplasmopsis bovis]|uniref:GTPase Era n=2 Tax=Mycoplasmopsis bovis TaxID=28903 RepID=A0A059Y7U9_MYCBV|nr:GTPase Era [Mycoplasmopsis bovis]AEI89833.1 GTP-binding protein Era [Mycoplasmopsis bovis Hubei-1]AFM51500.1 GTP-binding protein [Mycoplasmopsis bovis HB0801]AIA33712.1 GTPase Era [Mycoplasmopsis bovis CQ-W70]AKO50352.1 GTP-binding protein Era [Mycoplasmopsis bovis]AMW24819.1 GTP-binding protein Era [Mycoplasmopsis bovis]
MKVCIISILGRPNVGKSSLLNKIIKYDLAIVSNVPQTTRDQIMGVYTENDYQFVFVDTPGIHKPLNLLGESLNKEAFSSINDIDCILFLTPVNEEIKSGDKLILERIANSKNKIAVISKIDLAKSPDDISKKIKSLEEFNFQKIISVSNKNDKSIDSLIEILKEYSYEAPPFYDEDYITDKSMRFMAKEYIRESAINLLTDELPHSIAVEVQDFIEEEDRITINAVIYVKKDSQKGILIGKGASMIKKIGTNARMKMGHQFNSKVTLNLKVKVSNKWINDKSALKKFGYN